jgi:hypothetical protein
MDGHAIVRRFLMVSAKVLDIDRQAAELAIEEQRELMSRIARRVERGAPVGARPMSLRGVWAGRFPDDLDVEGALRAIRSGWTRKLDDVRP